MASNNKVLKWLRKRIKVYAFNIVGVVLIIIAPFIGLLPGPGGIPLLLLGLYFLSHHNPWAKKLKDQVEKQGVRLGDLVFLDNRRCQILWDIFIALSVGVLITVLIVLKPNFILTAIITFAISTLLVLGLRNRHRWRRFLQWYKGKFKK